MGKFREQASLFVDRDSSIVNEDVSVEVAPLSARMRPRNLDEYVGQEHLLGKGKALRRFLENGSLPSLILWGPPGTGKTSLARIFASKIKANFVALSAVTAGTSDVREIIKEAKERWNLLRKRTILFLDEIHRFNKAQQDTLLPHVEEGTITLIGATTENPSFQVIAPLLSRCRVFTLKSLQAEDIKTILARSLQDKERGLGNIALQVDEEFLSALSLLCGGDGRSALNILEESPSFFSFHHYCHSIIFFLFFSLFS